MSAQPKNRGHERESLVRIACRLLVGCLAVAIAARAAWAEDDESRLDPYPLVDGVQHLWLVRARRGGPWLRVWQERSIERRSVGRREWEWIVSTRLEPIDDHPETRKLAAAPFVSTVRRTSDAITERVDLGQVLEEDENGPVDAVVLRLPLGVGLEWTGKVSAATARLKVDAREDVETPAGRFAGCWKVTVHAVETQGEALPGGPILMGVTWYAPGIGMVREQTFYPGLGLIRESLYVGKAPVAESARHAALRWLADRESGTAPPTVRQPPERLAAGHPCPHAPGTVRTWLRGFDLCRQRRLGWTIERFEREREIGGARVVDGLCEVLTPGGSAHAVREKQEFRQFVWEWDGAVCCLPLPSHHDLTAEQVRSTVCDIPVAPEVGGEWNWTERGATLLIRLEARETVASPAGTYADCWKVVWRLLEGGGRTWTRDQAPVVEIFWYAPGLGRVRIQRFQPKDGRLVEELILAAEHAPLTAEEDARAQQWFAEKMGR